MDHQAGFLAAVSTLEHVHSPEGSSDEVKSHVRDGGCSKESADLMCPHCCEFNTVKFKYKAYCFSSRLLYPTSFFWSAVESSFYCCEAKLIYNVAMANILMLPYLTAPVLGISSTLVVDFVGLVLMGACYVCHTH